MGKVIAFLILLLSLKLEFKFGFWLSHGQGKFSCFVNSWRIGLFSNSAHFILISIKQSLSCSLGFNFALLAFNFDGLSQLRGPWFTHLKMGFIFFFLLFEVFPSQEKLYWKSDHHRNDYRIGNNWRDKLVHQTTNCWTKKNIWDND